MTEQPDVAPVDPLLRAQLQRAGWQLATLHGAVSRLFGGDRRDEPTEQARRAAEAAGITV